MASWSLEKAPSWAPDAIATTRGWVDPKTGDLLVACKRLKNAVSHIDEIGKGVTQKVKNRGGVRKGAGRKTDAERAEIALQKLEAGEQVTEGEAKAVAKIEGVELDESQIIQPKKPAKKKQSTKKAVKKKGANSKDSVKTEKKDK